MYELKAKFMKLCPNTQDIPMLNLIWIQINASFRLISAWEVCKNSANQAKALTYQYNNIK